MKAIHQCSKCKKYTMQKTCGKCKGETNIPRPPKFSLDDKYASYRRKVRRSSLEERKLI